MDFLRLVRLTWVAPDAATSLLPVTIIQAGQDKSQQHLQIYDQSVLLNPVSIQRPVLDP